MHENGGSFFQLGVKCRKNRRNQLNFNFLGVLYSTRSAGYLWHHFYAREFRCQRKTLEEFNCNRLLNSASGSLHFTSENIASFYALLFNLLLTLIGKTLVIFAMPPKQIQGNSGKDHRPGRGTRNSTSGSGAKNGNLWKCLICKKVCEDESQVTDCVQCFM